VLRPDERAQPFAGLRVADVERVEVEAQPPADLQVGRERRAQLSLGRAADPDRRVLGADGDLADLVAVSVRQQVEPGAGTDLEQGQRRPGLVGHQPERRQRDDGAARLVRLRGAGGHELGEAGATRIDEGREGRVEAVVDVARRTADDGGVVRPQRVAVASEQQVVDRREQDERVLEAGPRVEQQGGALRVLGQPLADRAVAWRVVSGEVARPDAQVVEQRAYAVGIGRWHRIGGLSRTGDGW
jgi:hypothetical protein